jgi:apolipoprotein N-acyltransferase
MESNSKRSMFAIAVGIGLSLILFIWVSKSPYVFALGLAVAAFLARLSTFKSGILHGLITALPPSLYLVLSDSFSGAGSHSLLSESLNVILLTGFGGIYCGVIVWLMNRLRQGKIFFS